MALEKRIIETSRTKVILLIALCLGFVAGGGWMLLQAEIETQRTLSSTIFIYGLGILNVGFFGLGVILGIWRLFSRKPALILNGDGITIFHIGSNTFVPWSDISGYSVFEVHSQKMLAVLLHDPSKYIEACSKFNQFAARANHNLCGSPVVMVDSGLEINFEELCKLCEEYLHKYKTLSNSRLNR